MDRPLVVQSDRTLLLDVHSPSAEECRAEIIVFTELVKSPEHVHTYQITALSLWNACSSGFSSARAIEVLKRWSRFDIPQSVLFFIEDTASRFGALTLDELDGNTLILTVKKEIYYRQILAAQSLKDLVTPYGMDSFTVPLLYRGELKVRLIKLGFPVDDLVPLKKGEKLEFSLSPDFRAREYQETAVKALLGNMEKGTGYGNIVLPCGSGKTIVGLIALQRLKTHALILCPNVASVHQWIREILDKTTLTRDMVGEYSGEVKEIRPITVCTYQVLTWRENVEADFKHFRILSEHNWGFVIYDEVHMLPAPVFKITSSLQSVYRLGLTATLVREDGREDEVFSLVGPKRYDVPWSVLEKQGFIAKAYCHEIRIDLPDDLEVKYALAKQREKYRIASENPRKLDLVEKLVNEHPDDRILIIGQYIDQLNMLKARFGWPMITGTTANSRRDRLYDDFRNGKERILIVSKVANFAIDLPDASMAIQVSGSFGSRQEEAQRLGRILRPKLRDSHFYTIVTKFSNEEEFALNRQKFLSEQGYSYTVENLELEEWK
ncbi:MAG: DEAD/DEAH box helicase [Spirochaetales bacterium]|nr:DEAD/DEAH box helicase [Spirochaetales bacterium]